MKTIASESMNVSDADKEKLFQQEYQAVIDSISLDVEIFTHPITAYQFLAGQGNEEAEKLLNLVHTTASMQRAKDVITSMPPTASDDIDYEIGDSEDIFGDEYDDEEEFMDTGGEAGPSLGLSIRSVQLEFDQFGLHIYNANVKKLVDIPGYEYFSYLGQKTLRDAQMLLEAETKKSAKQSSELNSLNEVVSCLKNELNFEKGFQDELEVAVFELKSSKTTISELKREKQNLKLSLEKKIEDSVKLESYVASVKESLKCLHDNLLVQTGLKEKLECTVLDITSQLDKVQDKLCCFESLDAKMVKLRQLPSNLDIKRSQNNLSVHHKDCQEESSRPTGLSCQLAEIHEHVLAAVVTLTFIKTQYESLI
ncbi:hypothetical protein AgCh_015556 [Apium graveolens]